MYDNDLVEKQQKKILALSETVKSNNGSKRDEGKKYSF